MGASHCAGFSCCGVRVLGHTSFSSCGTWAQQLRLSGSRAQAQQSWGRGLVARWHVGSSPTRGQTCVSCFGRQITTEPPGKPQNSPFLIAIPLDIFKQSAIFCAELCFLHYAKMAKDFCIAHHYVQAGRKRNRNKQLSFHSQAIQPQLHFPKSKHIFSLYISTADSMFTAWQTQEVEASTQQFYKSFGKTSAPRLTPHTLSSLVFYFNVANHI